MDGNKVLDMNKEEALELLKQMWAIRWFEDQVYDLLGQNKIKGASHLYAGEEAVAVGAMSVIQENDLITSTHRGHGHCYARGAVAARNEEEHQEHYNKMLAELCGRTTGYSAGRGGSMHIADVERGNLGATGIVGQYPGCYWRRLSPEDEGHGECGALFLWRWRRQYWQLPRIPEYGGLWDLPVVYIIENNLYGMSVPIKNAAAKLSLADRGCAYGIEHAVVDGMDLLAVREAVRRAVDHARSGKGPYLLEAQTYRWYGHSRSDPRAYRTKDEEAEWKARDPIPNFSKLLVEQGVATQGEIDAIEQKVEKAIEQATDFALGSPMPPAEELENFVYVPFKWTQADVEREKELRELVRRGGAGTHTADYRQALQEAMREEMQRDERVFLMGEDIGLYGGAYGATKGLFQEFGGERVLDTPISEAGIAGVATGAAMAGMRPMVEIMYVDFPPLAMDQLANQAAKNVSCSAAKLRCPWSCGPRVEPVEYRSPSFAVPRGAVDALSAHLCRDAQHSLRRQGPA